MQRSRLLLFSCWAPVLAPALSIIANHTQRFLNDADPVKAADINPIYYLHVPRTGSTLATAVAHMACDKDMQASEVAQDPNWFVAKHESDCGKSAFLKFESGSDPLKLKDPADISHVVMMMRSPAQRILSGYQDLRGCWDLRKQFHCKEENNKLKCDADDQNPDGTFIHDPKIISPILYGKCVENCTANMLTGRECDATGEVDVQHAMGIINKLGFVGLTEEWELSMCLWHRRFGGRLVGGELTNEKKSFTTASNGWTGRHDEQILEDWRPDSETRIYNAAARRFWQEVSTFGLDRSLCESEAILVQD